MHNQPAKWAAAIACRSLRELVYVWSSFPGVPLALHPKALLFRLLRRLGNASTLRPFDPLYLKPRFVLLDRDRHRIGADQFAIAVVHLDEQHEIRSGGVGWNLDVHLLESGESGRAAGEGDRRIEITDCRLDVFGEAVG